MSLKYFCVGKIANGKNRDVVVDEYHRYKVEDMYVFPEESDAVSLSIILFGPFMSKWNLEMFSYSNI